MVKIFAVFFLFSHAVFAFELDRRVLDNRSVPFIPHTIPKPFLSYVSYEIQYPPVKELLEELKLTTGPISDRGEAHITVITPPEFDDVLGKVLTIEEINELVLSENIQGATFEPVCVGTGAKDERRAWFVVVNSPDLIRIREAVYTLYLSKPGADPKAFNPARFYPHITLGFIAGDVHESDGLYKDVKTCLSNGQITLR